jgi:hypothetical protein
MPFIKPRTRGKQLVKHRTRLDRENNETLYAYAHFLGESTEYVLNQLIDTVLARDKQFVQWRAAHQHSFVPGSRATRNSSSGEPRTSIHSCLVRALRGGRTRATVAPVIRSHRCPESRRPQWRYADRGSIALRILIDARALSPSRWRQPPDCGAHRPIQCRGTTCSLG